ncbi:GTPase [Actinomyces slackii]|uniref:GTPase Era n=1 Tax=Actinomyces slackii TaxID=52774 RepID=A0A3S4WL77_9ACTO|nr:GTPase [Actinomyces slackii]VEG75334.1 GTPase Era [Actinomyces slackii]
MSQSNAVQQDESGLAARLEALEGVVELGSRLGMEARLGPTRELLQRAGQRRRLAPGTTVVALLGATGAGKSSLVNALAGAPIARVAVTRPTTSQPLALLPGTGEDQGAGDAIPALLDWLGVGQRVVAPEALGQRLGASTILLDLPDIDSDHPEHRALAEQLAGKVDVLVWVLDPEKYADAVVHQDFLAPMSAHGEVTLVALNQIDRLDQDSARAVMDDAARLLAANGLDGVPLLAVSARTGAGLQSLSEAIAAIARNRAAATRRLSADARTVAGRLRVGLGLSGGQVRGRADDEAGLRLHRAASAVAGTELIASAVAGAHRHRARSAVGWLPVRWIERLRRDPLTALHLGQRPGAALEHHPAPAGRSSLPEAGPGDTGALWSAAHAYALNACAGLPEDAAAEAVARSDDRARSLAPALDEAVAGVEVGQRRPAWWSVANALQWALGLTALAGGLWLAGLHLIERYLLIAADPPRWGQIPWPVILLVSGIVLGILLALAGGLAARAGAARRRRAAAAALEAAVSDVIESQVMAPLRAELDDWQRVAELLDRAT